MDKKAVQRAVVNSQTGLNSVWWVNVPEGSLSQINQGGNWSAVEINRQGSRPAKKGDFLIFYHEGRGVSLGEIVSASQGSDEVQISGSLASFDQFTVYEYHACFMGTDGRMYPSAAECKTVVANAQGGVRKLDPHEAFSIFETCGWVSPMF
jgi:hypothetical protein